MPIYGVSDRESVEPRFRNIGKLRKGSPKQSNGQVGKDLTYFRFTSNNPAVVKAFTAAYGEEPRELAVFLPYNEMERNFSSWRELYGGNGLVKVRCDGENHVDWIDGAQHHHGRRPCTKEFKDTANRCQGCPLVPVGRLSVILPELWKAGHIGLVTMETHSWNDIPEISGKLVQYEPLAGKPFTLWREEKKVGAPNKKTNKRMAVTKSLVFIELTEEHLVLTFEATKRIARAEVMPALPDSIPEDAIPWDETEPEYLEPEPDAPPPLAEIQTPAPEPQVVAPPPAMPEGWAINDDHFPEAVTLLGFPHVGAVKFALLQTVGNDWKGAKPAEAWSQLIDYQLAIQA
jgi:hypothetical protein